MEYLKHKYSKRIYQVMTDHGPEHPYLSCFPYVRQVGNHTREKFFLPCGKPPEGYETSVTMKQEIEWEKKQILREQPIEIKAPPRVTKALKKKRTKSTTTSSGDYTLKDLCSELGMSPATARKLLRSNGKSAPEGGWKWPDSESAKPIKEFLQKFL